MSRSRRCAAALLVLIVSPTFTAWAAAQTVPAIPWEMTLESGRRAPSTVTALNRCFNRHVFEVTRDPRTDWFRLGDETRLEVAPGSSRTVGVEIDATGLAAGLYAVEVTVRCLDCTAEPGCTQDREVFRARLKVPWTEGELEDLDGAQLIAAQVLVLLPPAADRDRRRVARRLERRHRLRRLRSFELPTVGAGAILLALREARQPLAPILRSLVDAPELLWAQPNFRYFTAADEGGDPYLDLQYGVRLIRADGIDPGAAGAGVTVAVIDSGVDAGHPDLEGRIVDSVSFVEGAPAPAPEVHGTAVAGLIAAAADNAVGIRGVAPAAGVLAIKACEPVAAGAERAVCTSEAVARGLDLAVRRGARVVNLSLGGPRDPLVAHLAETALAAGAVVVAAAGNAGPEAPPSYPAALPQVVAVSAIDVREAPYEAANRGAYVELSAPGVEVLATSPAGRFLPLSGTSMAAAHVTGAVALALGRRPDLSPERIRSLLAETARDLGPAGRDETFGHGLVDAAALIEKSGR